MEGESGVTGSIIDELHCWDIPEDQMEGESVVTRSIIHKLHSWDIQGHETEGESAFTRSTSMYFILRISKEIKW